MKTPELHLYVDAQFASPYAMSVFVALREKNQPFEMSTVDLGKAENHDASFAALSITQRVPTLVHRNFHLSETSAICEYVDETFSGTPLYPTAPQDRARARQVQAWLRSDLMPIRQERPTEVIFYGLKKPPLSPAAQEAASRLFSAASLLLKAGAEHLIDQWCVADMDLALMLNRLLLNGDAVPAPLTDYAAHQWRRPSVQEWLQLERPPLQRPPVTQLTSSR